MAEENKVGRPLKFESAEVLQKKIDEYFESCFEERWYMDEGEWKPVLDRNGEVVKEQTKPFTVSGLAVHLDTTRRTLLDYEARDDEFSHAIRAAKNKIESFVEESLWKPKIATGVMFNLTNNFGWVNKSEVDSNVKAHHSVEIERMTDDELREGIEATVQAIADLQKRIGPSPST